MPETKASIWEKIKIGISLGMSPDEISLFIGEEHSFLEAHLNQTHLRHLGLKFPFVKIGCTTKITNVHQSIISTAKLRWCLFAGDNAWQMETPITITEDERSEKFPDAETEIEIEVSDMFYVVRIKGSTEPFLSGKVLPLFISS
ncbi:MAG: hypothetical protein HGA61_02075 [Candidatus Moranbacteria bacterium]|nr:hypothetical protein [Candidatus Moranbacteria bacterium]